MMKRLALLVCVLLALMPFLNTTATSFSGSGLTTLGIVVKEAVFDSATGGVLLTFESGSPQTSYCVYREDHIGFGQWFCSDDPGAAHMFDLTQNPMRFTDDTVQPGFHYGYTILANHNDSLENAQWSIVVIPKSTQLPAPVPSTGDSAPVAVWFGLLAASAVLLAKCKPRTR